VNPLIGVPEASKCPPVKSAHPFVAGPLVGAPAPVDGMTYTSVSPLPEPNDGVYDPAVWTSNAGVDPQLKTSQAVVLELPEAPAARSEETVAHPVIFAPGNVLPGIVCVMIVVAATIPATATRISDVAMTRLLFAGCLALLQIRFAVSLMV